MEKQRQIFIVVAQVVDANGTWNMLDGYPAKFDSKSYDHDIDKTKSRASGELGKVWDAMCKADTRQLQSAFVMTADGFIVEGPKVRGQLAPVVIPDPEPEVE